MPDNLKYQRSVSRIPGQVIIDKTAHGEPLCVSLDDISALEAARTQLEQELADIKTELDRLPKSSPRFLKAFSAKRLKGAAHQVISRRVAELKKQQRQHRELSLQERFIEVARRKLPRETYLEIWNEAREAQGSDESSR